MKQGGLVRVYPVLEFKDLYYGAVYGWLPSLLEVTDTVMLRLEPILAGFYRQGLTLREGLVKHGVPRGLAERVKVMMDHGIFTPPAVFKQWFNVDKTPEGLVDVYSALRVDYALALDVPGRLQVEASVELARSRLKGKRVSERILRAVHPELESLVEELAELSVSLKALKPGILLSSSVARGLIEELSARVVELTLGSLKRMLEYKVKRGGGFTLLPVIQGLTLSHVDECVRETIELMVSHNETAWDKTLYIAVGTGGSILSREEARLVNHAMRRGVEHAERHGFKARYHVLGWSSPRLSGILDESLVYSGDSLTARRRAVEGKIYDYRTLRLVSVERINPGEWNCSCPACRNPILREYILEPGGKRRSDARIIHNLWILQGKRNIYESGII